MGAEISGAGSILEMVTQSGPVVQGVLLLLLVVSVVSWGVIIAKVLAFRQVKRENAEFSRIFWESRNLTRIGDSAARFSASPLSALFQSGFQELREVKQGTSSFEVLHTLLERVEYEQSKRLEGGLTFLATVASTAPFVGLFGTVWGIMHAFHGLSAMKSTTLQAVAPGISEALVATAVGLAAAIPASIGFNYFSRIVGDLRESMERFRGEFFSIAAGLTTGESGTKGSPPIDTVPMSRMAEN